MDDKLFQTLVSRVSSRETAFLTLTTITSSASLLLLGLFFIIKNDYSIHILILGVLFPSLSIVYTEITLNTIHKHDWEWIRKIVKENNDSEKDTEAILAYKEHRVVRRVLTKLILSLPLFGWAFIYPEFWVNAVLVSIIIVYIVVALKKDKISKLK